MKRFVYLDHAATTPVHPDVLAAMMPFFAERFGNASSVYLLAQESKHALDKARQTVAEVLGCAPQEIVFTGSGSESDNLAIKGVAFARRHLGNHIITSTIEHHAVLYTCQYLERYHGFRVTYVPVDGYGQIDLRELERAITPQTILITVMLGNNEVGTIQPLAEIAAMIRGRGIMLHTDAVQAANSLSLQVDKLGVDLLSLSAHKFYGPKGVGLLYIREGTEMHPLVHGGGQERDRRAGTENVAGIVGLATALHLAAKRRAAYVAHTSRLRQRLTDGMLARIDRVRPTGHPTERLPHIASFCFEGTDGESILLNLDLEGIGASSGSACTSGSLEPSHVLVAMGLPLEVAKGSVRFSFGMDNTEEEIDRVLEVLPGVIHRLRALSASIV
ncbi:MAG: IscS subfamily cysteine desulfurase [Chloroflexi bacterium]|nr:IscS subfamily cysteine desulfurase [Chloroflexota bacterium]